VRALKTESAIAGQNLGDVDGAAGRVLRDLFPATETVGDDEVL
jgi:hypothetical protein